jgi:hypothetical protein
MYVIEPGAESWRQVAAVVASELGRLEVVRLVVHAKSEAMIPEYLQLHTGAVCVQRAASRRLGRRLAAGRVRGPPVKPPPPSRPPPFPPSC